MNTRRTILLIAGALAAVALWLVLRERQRAELAPSRDEVHASQQPARPAQRRAAPAPSPADAQRAATPDAPAQPATLADLIASHGPGTKVSLEPAPPADIDLTQVHTGPVHEGAERRQPASKTQCNVVDGSGGCADPLPGDQDRDGHPTASDCDDLMRDVHPGAPEVRCNGVDDDCQGGDLCPPDRDGDGDGVDIDCDDRNPARNRRAEEVPCNGVDEDCSGADVCDRDRDGDPAPHDCADQDPGRHQNAKDVVCDGIDQDCSGGDCCDEDRDGDGHPCKTDCDDVNPAIHPGAPPPVRCNNTDYDCDGKLDGCKRRGGLELERAPSP